MSENVVINNTTYNGVDALSLVRSDGTVATFYPDAVRYSAQTLTEAQKAQARQNLGVGSVDEVAAEVLARLGTPVFGTVDENNTITLTGALADGTYTLKYEDAEGNLTEIGTLNITADPVLGDIPITWIRNIKIDKETGAETTDSLGIYCTNEMIPLDPDGTYVVTVTNWFNGDLGINYCYYDADGNYLGYVASAVTETETLVPIDGARGLKFRAWVGSGNAYQDEYLGAISIARTAENGGESYTNIIDTVGYQDNMRVKSDGTYVEATGFASSNPIEVLEGDVLYAGGLNYSSSAHDNCRVSVWAAHENSYISLYDTGVVADTEQIKVTFENGIVKVESVTGYWERIAFTGYGPGEDMIVTKNEPII